MTRQGATPQRTPRLRMFRMFLAERSDPEPFYRQLAAETVAGFPFAVQGQRMLDLGSGPGYYTEAFAADGATVVSADLDADDLAGARPLVRRPMVADAGRLPFPAESFDGVFCSNMLEHTPAPDAAISEMVRVLAPGGWLWLSWTNWYSPWGGHSIAPFHYLGPRLGLRVRRRLFGEPEKNLPFAGLWPTHIGQVLRIVEAQDHLDLLDAVPRYYPSQRWLIKVPGLREVLAWNCLITARKVG